MKKYGIRSKSIGSVFRNKDEKKIEEKDEKEEDEQNLGGVRNENLIFNDNKDDEITIGMNEKDN